MKLFSKIIAVILIIIFIISITAESFYANDISSLYTDTKASVYKPSIHIKDESDRSYRVWAWSTDNVCLFDCDFSKRPSSENVKEDEFGYKCFTVDKEFDNSLMYCIRVTKDNTDIRYFNDTYSYGDIWINIDKNGTPLFYNRNPEIEITASDAFTNTLWVDTNSEPGSINSLVKWSKKAEGKYALYLPSGVSLNLPVYHTFSLLKINEKEINPGDIFTFENDTTYDIKGDVVGKLEVIQSSGTDTMFLSTPMDIPHNTCYDKNNPSSDTTYVLYDKSKLNIKGGSCLTTDEKGKVIVSDGISKIKGRGNSSWLFSFEDFGKYSFNLTLESKTKKITDGNVKTKKYVLNACNTDQAFIRNSLIYKIAEKVGIEYTPTLKIYNVYNNGVYLGTYSVTEKVDVGSSSLVSDIHSLSDDNEKVNPDIESLSKSTCGEYRKPGYYTYVDSKDPDDITGGYLLELDLFTRTDKEISGFIADNNQAVTIQSPEYATRNEVLYIKNFFNKIESIIYSENPDIKELSEYIDLESFAKMFLIEELSKDVDACATSYFVYKDSDKTGDGKLHAAPVWDFDWACGQTFLSKAVPKDSNSSASLYESWGWNARYRLMNSLEEMKICNFEAQLCQSDDFWNTVFSVWKKSFYKEISSLVYNYKDTNISESDSYISKMYKKYIKSFEMNEDYWNFIVDNPSSRFGTYSTGKDVKSCIEYLNKWIFDRTDWINKNIGPAKILYGDSDGNDKIAINDCTMVQQVLAKLITDEDTLIQKRSAMHGSNLVITDATEIQMFLALLPVGDKINTHTYPDKSLKVAK